MLERTSWVKLFAVLSLVNLATHNAAAWTSPSGWTTRSPATVLYMTAPDQLRKKSPKREPKAVKATPAVSILEDGYGHINAELAHTLWTWEQQHREDANMTTLSFSTRQGLRLVDNIVKKVAESTRGQKFLKANDDTTTDLVQEGIMALMDALNDYRESQDQQQNVSNRTTMEDHNLHFESYARPYIEDRLWSILDETSRPLQLPQKMSDLWKKVRQMRRQLQEELGGQEPTTVDLAARLEMPVEKLEMLMRTRQSSLSMESTVEIKNPDSLEDRTAHFADQDEWEEREGHLLDTGDKVIKDELVDDYLDEQYQYEGGDEMWIHQEQIAGPLREIIPDASPSPDDIALNEMIRHDVGEFLTKILTPDEVKIVRMSFGLDGMGKTQSMSDVAAAMGLAVNDAKDTLKEALAKLRTSYKNDYVETYLDDETDFFGEDSV
jgi:DNA-directed RNA polymerase sigma subunit (sigma70/sigma32)